MTARTRRTVHRRMLDVLVMTARARSRRVFVRRVAIGAARVGSWREHRLIAVTRRARLDFRRTEPMRNMAARALCMTRGDRAFVDVELTRSSGVTARAAGIRRALGL